MSFRFSVKLSKSRKSQGLEFKAVLIWFEFSRFYLVLKMLFVSKFSFVQRNTDLGVLPTQLQVSAVTIR